jgi:hypothetical protein
MIDGLKLEEHAKHSASEKSTGRFSSSFRLGDRLGSPKPQKCYGTILMNGDSAPAEPWSANARSNETADSLSVRQADSGDIEFGRLRVLGELL